MEIMITKLKRKTVTIVTIVSVVCLIIAVCGLVPIVNALSQSEVVSEATTVQEYGDEITSEEENSEQLETATDILEDVSDFEYPLSQN